MAACLLSLLLCAGCATPKTPVFINAQFQPAAVERIAVLPVLDVRIDKTIKIDIDKWSHGHSKILLKKKRYMATILEDRSVLDSVDFSSLPKPDAAWIMALPPDGDRWVMLFVLEDLQRKLTFGSTGSAEMSAYLFDKQSTSIVWRDKAIGRIGQGGLLGMAMIGAMAQSAVQAATTDLLRSFPEKPKTNKKGK